MSIDKHDIRAIRALNIGTDYADYFNALLYENNYETHTAITPSYIRDISPLCAIVLSSKVFNTICAINTYTKNNRLEVPFFLFGREENGIVYFHTADYHTENLGSHHASFKSLARGIDVAMWDFLQDNDADSLLQNFGEKSIPKFRRAIRCYGHTHPPGCGGDQFSFADLSCTVEHVLINEFFASDEMGSMDLLVPPSGDMNFIKYEQNRLFEGFYKYRNVYVITDDGEIKRAPAYEKGRYYPYPLKKRHKKTVLQNGTV